MTTKQELIDGLSKKEGRYYKKEQKTNSDARAMYFEGVASGIGYAINDIEKALEGMAIVPIELDDLAVGEFKRALPLGCVGLVTRESITDGYKALLQSIEENKPCTKK